MKILGMFVGWDGKPWSAVFENWLVSWVSLAGEAVRLMTFGFLYPTWDIAAILFFVRLRQEREARRVGEDGSTEDGVYQGWGNDAGPVDSDSEVAYAGGVPAVRGVDDGADVH